MCTACTVVFGKSETYVKLASFPLLRVTYTSGTKSASIVLEYLSKGDLKHFLTVSDVIPMNLVV